MLHPMGIRQEQGDTTKVDAGKWMGRARLGSMERSCSVNPSHDWSGEKKAWPESSAGVEE